MSNLKILILFLLLGFGTAPAFSWYGMPTPFLHVEGRHLKDPNGNTVVLRGGWMQPTETWFNGGGRWYSNPTDYTNPNNVAGMLNYLKEAATLMSDPSPRYGRNHGWYNTFVRVNTDAIGGWTQQSGLVNQAQFDGWIQNFLVPYANHLRTRGLYLILSATGPVNTPNNGSRNAGVTEQSRLRTFWTTVANAPGVKNADNIMFELMNEPVEIESAPGNGDWGMGQAKYYEAFRNWIQPVIDDIRRTGANNVVWVPTLEWQGSPQQHIQYPFTGSNVGVAVHYYPAYGNCRDNVTCHNNLWNRQYKPVAERWPMIITENFWFPEDDGLVDGSTANYGNTLKANIDAAGNVSYMIGFLSDLIDVNSARPLNASLLPKEGAQAAFDWWYRYNGSSGCTPSPVTPYIQVDDGDWQQLSGITVISGTKVEFGPQPLSGGSWSWSGPGGFSAVTREITLDNVQASHAGDYVATYTNSSGCKSISTITLGICSPTAITPYCRVNAGGWDQSTALNAHAGDNIMLGPQPLSGGAWSWSGPNGFAATTREISLNNVQEVHSGDYTATYTNAAGCQSKITIAVAVNTITSNLVPSAAFSAATVYPNPAESSFTVTVQEEAQRIEVIDMKGAVLFACGKVEKGRSVDCGSDLTSGLYTITIRYSNGRVEAKRVQKL